MIFKDTKITLLIFLPYECTAVEEYLEKMAEEGWILKSVSIYFFTFKRIEPRKIKYSVDAHHKISVLDSKDSEEVLEYREFCKAAGWRFVCQTNKVQIFISDEEESTPPIHTDPEEWFKSVFKSSLYYVFSQLAMVIIFMLNIYVQLFVGTLDYTLSSNLSIVTSILMLTIIGVNFIQFVSFFSWVIKAKIKLKENKFKPYNKYKQLRRKNVFIRLQCVVAILTLIVIMMCGDVINFAGLLAIFISLVVILVVHKLIDKYKPSRGVNIIIAVVSTIAIFFLMTNLMDLSITKGYKSDLVNNLQNDEVNLTLKDFGVEEGNEAPYEDIQSSILAKRILYIHSYNDNSLSYTILESEYSWALNLYKDRLFKDLEKYGWNIKEKNNNLPEDIQLYSDENNRKYIFVSKDKVIETSNDIKDISEEESINKIYEKFFRVSA